jgi:hypothetical protein
MRASHEAVSLKAIDGKTRGPPKSGAHRKKIASA